MGERRVSAATPEELDLIEGLVEEILVVLDDLDAHQLPRVQVHALRNDREDRSQMLDARGPGVRLARRGGGDICGLA